ncbi:Dabb family protein, partial [bacterium]|nr:Dabb family protein [bacterium]
EVGVNYELTTKSHDICLVSHFENVEQLDAYRIHPDHLKVAELIGQHVVERAAVDYEF